MKILIVTNHSYMLYQFRRELIAALLQRHEVVLSMPFVGHEDDLTAMGCRCVETRVDRRGINPATDLALYRTYCRLLTAEKPDLVLTYSIKPNIYAGYACRRRGIPYCVNVQGLGTAFQKAGIAHLVTAMYRTALRKARTVFFENQGNAQEFLRRRIVPAQKMTVLHGAGVNLEQYTAQPYPDHGDAVHFLFLGRIMKEKGVDELFAAMQRLRAAYGARVVLDVVGFFEDAYKQTVEQLQTDGTVIFYGFQSDPRPFYAAADCVVLPSYHEGMSNVLLEAAATGRPLVTSDIPGCREAVVDGETGFLCRVKDTDSLYEAMRRIVELPAHRRAAMGRLGREKMQRDFDKKRVVEQTVQAVEEIG